MPRRRNNRAPNRRAPRRSRRSGLAPFSQNTFNDNTRGTLVCPNGLSTQAFAYSDICPSLAGRRLISLRKVSLTFPPIVEITTGAVVDVQFQLLDPVSNNLITMNKGIILSTTAPRRMTMTIPSNYARYYDNTSSNIAFTVLVNNTGAAATWTILTNVMYHVAFEPNLTFTPRNIPHLQSQSGSGRSYIIEAPSLVPTPFAGSSTPDDDTVNVTLEMLRKLAVKK